MGSASGRDGAALIEQLREEAYRFDFFQAVRVLQRWAAREAAAGRTVPRQPVGADHAPSQEAVRLRSHVGLAFPGGAVAQVQSPPENAADDKPRPRPLEMLVTFLGLVGPHGVLPEHYTSLLIERVRYKDYALRDFLDLFHHRTLSLFYRAWEKYRFPIGYERSQAAGRDEDDFTQALYCLVGLGTGRLRHRQHFDDEARLYYAGLFAQRPPTAASLEQMLADFLNFSGCAGTPRVAGAESSKPQRGATRVGDSAGASKTQPQPPRPPIITNSYGLELPISIRQFQGQWLVLRLEDRSLLPSVRNLGGQNNQLGASVVIGERVWDVQSKFRVRIGPLDYAQFRRFLPNGATLPTLGQLVRTYTGPQWDFDVQPVLRAAEVPWCRLGGDGKDPSQLGWNTWVRNRPLARDAEEAVFVPKE